jgi:molecular chaperone HtpG
LISNSSDALDKIRHKHLKESVNSEYNIKLEVEKENRKLIITDSGVGMTKDELVQNLGTIAHSGTKAFMEAMASGNTDMSLIGQFGVGFYSAYLVADKVAVISKSEEENQVNVWESEAGGTYTIFTQEASDDITSRGTRIELTLKKDQLEYLEEHRLKTIIKTHSQYVGYPISLLVEKTKEEEVEDDEVNEDEIDEEGAEGEDDVTVEEAVDDDVPKEKKMKKITTNYTEWEQLNSEKPIWTRDPTEVSTEEYQSFYKNLTNDWDEYQSVKHFSVEGNLEFKGVLFIPKRKPFDIFDPNKKRNNIKLHVRKIFISDNCEDLVPEWLSFVKGLVDSEDLPLNVSREMLQQNKIIKVMKSSIIKKTFEMIDEISEDNEKYTDFYNNYGKNLKLGLYEDQKNREKLSEFLRFYTSKSIDEYRSLDQYISELGENDENIYYMTGESKESVDMSPFVEKLKKMGREVIYMVDAIDEYALQQLKEYKGKKLVSITKDNLKLDDDESIDEKEYVDLCKTIKEILDKKVENVKVSNRIVDSPCCLVTSEFGWSANMERIMRAQALGDDQQKSFMVSKKTMEVNPNHKIILELKSRLAVDKNDKTITDLVNLIYDISLLRCGFSLDNTQIFSNRLYRIIEMGLSIDDVDNSSNIVDDTLEDVVEESEMEEVD